MKIKQQKQIKAFLEEEFGKERGGALFDAQEKTLEALIGHTENKSENPHADHPPAHSAVQGSVRGRLFGGGGIRVCAEIYA